MFGPGLPVLFSLICRWCNCGGRLFLVVKDKQLQLEDETRKEVSLKETFQKKAFEASNLEKYRQQIAEMEESFEALKNNCRMTLRCPVCLRI